MTARAAFRQADLERACKGVTAAGLKVARVVINDNGIEVIIGEPEGRGRANPLDKIYGT